MNDVLEFAARYAQEGQSVAIVTVTAVRGSSPASVGQVMAVVEDGTACGTVGGGTSEHMLRKRAVQALADGEEFFDFDFEHVEHDMTCGGGIAGFGKVYGSGLQLVVFGGGHVAQAITKVAVPTGFAVTVVEDRPEFEGEFEGCAYLLSRPEEYPDKVRLNKNTYVVICTRGHQFDEKALRFCIGRELAYLGMIGSARKVGVLFEHLREEGVAQEALDRVFAPVGLDIATRNPPEIAIAILAEMLMVKNGGSSKSMRAGE